MTNRPSRLTLSRRKLLAGLGTIGVASVGAGLGTTAFFNDEETFEANELQAGEFDLKVDWQQKYWGNPEQSGVYGSYGYPYVNAYPDNYRNDPNNPDAFYLNGIGGPQSGTDGVRDPIRTRSQIRDGGFGQLTEEQAEAAFRLQFADVPDYYESDELPALVSLDDVKPGDSGEICFSLHLFDNPGYIWMTGELHANLENGQTEPEADDPDDTAGETNDDDGELVDAVQVEIAYVDEDAYTDDQYEGLTGGEQVFFEGTLREALAAVEAGLELDADLSTLEVRDCFPNSTSAYVRFRWELPADHGNDVQSDSVLFDLGFYAEQCRHNDDPQYDPSNATN